MINRNVFSEIASAIREKDGSSETMKISQMAQRIRNIPSGGGGGGDDGYPEVELEDNALLVYFHHDEDTPTEYGINTYTVGQTILEWGDGTVEEYTGSGASTAVRKVHTFRRGHYVLKLKATENYYYAQTSQDNGLFFKSSDNTAKPNGYALNMKIEKVRFGANLKLYQPLASYCFMFTHTSIDTLDLSPLGWYRISQGYGAGCTRIHEIIMPSRPTRIHSWNSNLYSLKTVDCSKFEIIPILDISTFYTTPNLEIIVPDILYDDIIVDTNWSRYAEYIVKKSESRKYGGSA